MNTPGSMPTRPKTRSIASPRESSHYPSQGRLDSPNPRQRDASQPLTSDLSTEINNLFVAAAKTVGYAMNLDGLVFFDAIPTRGYAPGDKLSRSEAHEDDPLTTSLSEYRRKGSVEPQLVHQPRQSVIRRLTAEYPQGRLFVLDEHGILECGSDWIADTDRTSRDNPTVYQGWDNIFTCIPNARTAIFLPLWHYQREVCFATCLAWTNDTAKTLDSGDVNSLTAFGNSLMAEIFRLEALTNTQAKSDFVSSISHELRSPLHGILATVELIQESVKDSDTLSMTGMIESCSNTLLDTFDHLLEFSNINSRASDVRSIKKIDSKHAISTDVRTRKEVFDMRALVEDVVETGSLGHFSEMGINHSLKTEQRQTSPGQEEAFESDSLTITTNIENDRDWVIPTWKGPWKRILLNIFSNALKYTRSGHIDVALKMLDKTDLNPQYISLIVTDTGIGMSHEFLKYHLFAPFMQESNLSSGTGLGLSIVKNIVESLQGKVHIESHIHEGTCVTVNVPFDQERDPLNLPGIGRTPVQQDQLQGLSLGLFSIAPSDLPGTDSALRIVSSPKVLLRSIRNICEGQFGMLVADASRTIPPNTDVLAIDTHALTSSDRLDLEVSSLDFTPQTIPRVVILLGVPSQGITKLLGVEEATCVTSPITGRKIRAGLLSALSKAMPWITTYPTSPSDLARRVMPSQVYTKDLSIRDRSVVPQEEYSNYSSDNLSAQGVLKRVAAAPEIAKSPEMSLHQTTNATQDTTDLAIVCRFKRLLLVDDNPINLKVLAAFAKRMRLSFSTAVNGAEAVRLYCKAVLEEADPFDCIFMDISMPIMDGFQAVTAIRHFETQQNTDVHKTNSDSTDTAPVRRSYVLALTGLGSNAARNTARASGFDEFLLKPVKFKDIAPLLRVTPKG